MEGIFAAVTTPFYADERVYFRKIEANMARYSRSLLAGMAVLGSTGEAVLLDDAESRDVLRAAAEATAPEKVLIAGVGPRKRQGNGRVGRRGGAAQIRCRPCPPAQLLRQANVLCCASNRYFRCVADRSPLPVILYNVPKFVPNEIPIEVAAELAQHPNIIAMKDSSGSVERIYDAVAATRERAQPHCPRHA